MADRHIPYSEITQRRGSQLMQAPEDGFLTDLRGIMPQSNDSSNFADALGMLSQAKAPSEDTGDPLWMKLLNGLGAVGGSVTNQIANWTDGQGNWKDIPLAESLLQLGQGFGKSLIDRSDAWRDGKFNFDDITTGFNMLNLAAPAIDAVSNVGKKSKGTQEIFDNLGWHEAADDGVHNNFLTSFFRPEKGRFDIHDLASFAGDVALDPLTYVTLGATSALKAGQKAAQGAARQFGAKNLDDILRATMEDPKLANVSDALKTRLANRRIGKVQDIAKEARANAQNAAFNFDIPFTNITKSIGGKPRNIYEDFITTKDKRIGEEGLPQLEQMFAEKGITNPEQIRNMLFQSGLIGLEETAKDVPMQGFRFLQDQFANLKPGKNLPDFHTQTDVLRHMDEVLGDPTKARVGRQAPKAANPFAQQLEQLFSQGNVRQAMGEMPPGREFEVIQDMYSRMAGPEAPSFDEFLQLATKDFDDAVKLQRSRLRNVDFDQIRNTQRMRETVGRPLARSVADRTRFVPGAEEVVTQATGAVEKTPKPVKLDRFTQDMAERERIGKNPFNARSFGTGDSILDDAAGTIRDKDAQVYSWTRLMEQDLSALQKRMKGFTPDEQKGLIYLLENDFPEGMSKADFLQAHPKARELEGAADFAKQILQRVGQHDLKAGTVDRLMQDYFPHVFKKSDTELEELAKKYADDDEFQKLIGRSSTNTAGLERKSFKSIAQAERYMAKLAKEVASESDAAARASKQERLNAVASLFETDPIKALGQRYYKSIRSRAMKELQTQFEKDGLLVRKGKALEPKMVAKSAMYETLDAKQARQLGLEAGDKIHPEILKGLEKTRELFTDKGLNKFWVNVDAFQNGWKMVVTTYVPAHHVRNLLGNLANAALGGGLSKKHMAQGWRLLDAMKKGTLSEGQRSLLEEMADNGVLNNGFVSDFLDARTQNKLYTNAWAKMMRNFGETTDNIPRIMMYLAAKEKSGSTKLAGKQVRKFLFNYHEQTNADKAMRRVMPFWTWTKNNLPLQLEQLAKQPRFYLTYERFKESVNGEKQDDLPSWMREGYLQIPGTNQMINPGLPMNDLSMVDTSMQGLRNVIDMLSPIFKAPIEIGTNKQSFGNRPVSWDAMSEQRDLNGGEVANHLSKTFGGAADKLGRAGYAGLTGNTDAMLRELAGLLAGKPMERRE